MQAAGSHASTKPSRTIGLAQSFVSSVKYPHSCGSFGFHSLPPFPRPYTTTYPLYRVTYLVGLAGFGNYLVAFGCTYGLNTVHFHSVGLSVSFAAVSIRYTYRLAPWLLYLLSDLNKCFCLLTGIARCTSLGVLWEVAESNRLLIEALQGIIAALVGCHSTYFGDGPSIPFILMLPVCANYSGFYLPNMSILISYFPLSF